MPRKSFEHITLKTADFNNQNLAYTTRKHEDFIAGIAPNLRGLHPTMYISKPWDIKQKTVFSTVEESNLFYRKRFKEGQKEFSIPLDIASQNAYDSNDKLAQGDVGKGGAAIDSVEDIKVLFDTIPLDEISISLPMRKTILPMLAFYIVAAEEQGIAINQLSGCFEHLVLTKDVNSYPTSLSLKINSDIFKYINTNLPKFNATSISGNEVHEAGASAEIELAYTLACGLEHLKKNLEYGISIDSSASRLSFIWTLGMDHFAEIAKLRAARMLWAKIVKQLNPKDQKSLGFRIHCQTNRRSLTTQDPFNNVTRITTEAMAAVFGGTQSLHTKPLDEVLDLSTDYSERIAKNTQLFLQQETHITKTVDPWAGSYYIEQLTEEIANKTWKFYTEINDLGGLTKALEKGILQLRLKEDAVKKQAKIDHGKDIMVGVNLFQLKHEDSLPTLDVNKEAICKLKIDGLHLLKANRNTQKVLKSLRNLTNAVKSDEENLLELAIIAARERATLGEIFKAITLISDNENP